MPRAEPAARLRRPHRATHVLGGRVSVVQESEPNAPPIRNVGPTIRSWRGGNGTMIVSRQFEKGQRSPPAEAMRLGPRCSIPPGHSRCPRLRLATATTRRCCAPMPSSPSSRRMTAAYRIVVREAAYEETPTADTAAHRRFSRPKAVFPRVENRAKPSNHLHRRSVGPIIIPHPAAGRACGLPLFRATACPRHATLDHGLSFGIRAGRRGSHDPNGPSRCRRFHAPPRRDR
jgi:hypothetical protein